MNDKDILSPEQATPIDALTYEQAYEELEEITRSLEMEENSLDHAVALFERAQLLLSHCTTLLEQAEIKVNQILSKDSSGFQMED